MPCAGALISPVERECSLAVTITLSGEVHRGGSWEPSSSLLPSTPPTLTSPASDSPSLRSSPSLPPSLAPSLSPSSTCCAPKPKTQTAPLAIAASYLPSRLHSFTHTLFLFIPHSPPKANLVRWNDAHRLSSQRLQYIFIHQYHNTLSSATYSIRLFLCLAPPLVIVRRDRLTLPPVSPCTLSAQLWPISQAALCCRDLCYRVILSLVGCYSIRLIAYECDHRLSPTCKRPISTVNRRPAGGARPGARISLLLSEITPPKMTCQTLHSIIKSFPMADRQRHSSPIQTVPPRPQLPTTSRANATVTSLVPRTSRHRQLP